MPDYARNIEVAKQSAIDALNAEAPQMESTTYDILLQVIDDTFDTKAGKITVDKDFVKKLNKMTQDVIDLIQKSPDFKGPVSKFVGSMNGDVSGAISAFQQNINDIAVPAFAEIKKVVIDETIDQMLGNGLNHNFVQPLRDLIYQNATAGLSQSQAKKNILEYIKGGKDKSGKLSRYIDMTAQQAADSYSGAINKKLLETFKYDGLLITGSLIDTSSPQCRYAIVDLGGKISRDNWSDVVAHSTAKYPLILGTTFDNVPINRLHWGCRHSFFPIILKKAENILEPPKEKTNFEKIKQRNKKVFADLKKKGYKIPEDILNHVDPKIKFEVDEDNRSFYNDYYQKITLPEKTYNEFHKQQVIVHESSHAWHHSEKIIEDKTIRKDFKEVLSNLQAIIKGKELQLQENLQGLHERSVYRTEILSYGDTLFGLTKGEFGWGHDSKYMNTNNHSEMEVFAHAVEFYKLDFSPVYHRLPKEMQRVHDILAEYIKSII